MQNFLVNNSRVVNTSRVIPVGDGILDVAMSGGIRKGEVWVVGVSDSNVKHDWATQVARHIARAGYDVALSLPEKDSKYIFELVHSEISGVPTDRMRPGLSTKDFNQLMKTLDVTASLPILIDDTYSKSVHELEAKLKQALIGRQIRCWIADFIQPLSGNPVGRMDEIASNVNEFKKIAVSNDIGVIVFAQSQLEGVSKEQVLNQLAELCFVNGADLVTLLPEDSQLNVNGVN